jgi:hypothetical protein
LSGQHYPDNYVHESKLRIQEVDKIHLTLQACSVDNRVERLLVKCSDRFLTLEMRALERDEIGSFAKRSSKVFTAASIPSINHLVMESTDCGIVSISGGLSCL